MLEGYTSKRQTVSYYLFDGCGLIMDISPKALYNSLRMSFLQNPTFAPDRWKVEDYRQISQEDLFLRLQAFDLTLDRHTFLAFADEYDSPEELFDHLVSDKEELGEEQDALYLLIFELWRRLAAEKKSISIICDELDHQIFIYDQGQMTSVEALEDALAAFHTALEENVDTGMSRDQVFDAVSEYLANDFQLFMIDYISDLIEHQEYAYSEELLEQFYPFMPEKKWFDLFHARIIGSQDIRKGHELLAKIFRKELAEPDLQFNLDILSYLASLPDYELFGHVVTRSIGLVQDEEELLELIHIASDICHALDMHEKGDALHAIYDARRAQPKPVTAQDPDLAQLEKLIRG